MPVCTQILEGEPVNASTTPPKHRSVRQENPYSTPVGEWYEWRWQVRDRGGKVLNWERLPQSRVIDGIGLLSSGEVIDCKTQPALAAI